MSTFFGEYQPSSTSKLFLKFLQNTSSIFPNNFSCINREHFFTLHAEITRFCQENTFESHFKNVRRYIEHISGNRQPAIQGDWRRRAYPVQPKPIIKDYQCSRTNDKKEKENTLKVLAAEV